MAEIDAPPSPPPAQVKRFNSDGTPTPAQVEYDKRLVEWLKKLAQG